MEGNGPAQDFETMLRVRLERHRGRLAGHSGTATPCRGFDPERASAFLEGALSTNDTTRFEEHLTGCHSCRQAVIELQRMPVDVAIPAYEAASATSHGWLTTLIDSIRLAPLQWAGAAAVTCAFVVVVSMLAGRQTSSSVNSPEASTSAVDAPTIAQATPVPPPPLQLDAQMAAVADSPATKSNQVPQVRPEAQPVAPKPESLDLIFGRTGNRQVAQMTPSTTAGTAPQFSIPYNAPSSISPQLVQQSGGPSVAQTVQSLPPASQAASEKGELAATDMLPMQARTSVQRAASTASASERPKSSGAAMDFAPRANFMKGTPTPSPTPNIEDEDIRAMTRKVRDKTFRFERGRWVDQQFKPEYFYARVRLDRGSEQYKKILNDIPSLQAFFDLGPVIVVWEFKVYEVR